MACYRPTAQRERDHAAIRERLSEAGAQAPLHDLCRRYAAALGFDGSELERVKASAEIRALDALIHLARHEGKGP